MNVCMLNNSADVIEFCKAVVAELKKQKIGLSYQPGTTLATAVAAEAAEAEDAAEAEAAKAALEAAAVKALGMS